VGIVNQRVVAKEGIAEERWQQWPGLQAISEIQVSALIPAKKRLVIVAPHPDDEILMAGGLLQQLALQGNPRHIVAVTDGEASHPGSAQWPPERLVQERPRESEAALQNLGAGTISMTRLALPDGKLLEHAVPLYDALLAVIKPGDVVLTTWAMDGHPDHEVCGRVAESAAMDRQARFIAAPVWMWHWATPNDLRVPWHKARRLVLCAKEIAHKHSSMLAFGSQLAADPTSGRDAVLPPTMLARLSRNNEIFFL